MYNYAPSSPSSSYWLATAGAYGLALIAIVIGVWLVATRRRAQAVEAPHSGPPAAKVRLMLY